MSETKLKNKVKSYLKSIGAFHLKLSDRATGGIPDLVVFYRGRTVFVELKTPTGVVSKLQEWTIDQIKAQGCEAYICRSVEDVKKVIDKT